MADRPSVLSAKVRRLGEIVADADDIKAMDKSNRPGTATLDQVRSAYSSAMREITGEFASVSEVESVKTPTERLK